MNNTTHGHKAIKNEQTGQEDIILKHIHRYYQHKGKRINLDDILPMSRVIPLINECVSKAISTTPPRDSKGFLVGVDVDDTMGISDEEIEKAAAYEIPIISKDDYDKLSEDVYLDFEYNEYVDIQEQCRESFINGANFARKQPDDNWVKLEDLDNHLISMQKSWLIPTSKEEELQMVEAEKYNEGILDMRKYLRKSYNYLPTPKQ